MSPKSEIYDLLNFLTFLNSMPEILSLFMLQLSIALRSCRAASHRLLGLSRLQSKAYFSWRLQTHRYWSISDPCHDASETAQCLHDMLVASKNCCSHQWRTVLDAFISTYQSVRSALVPRTNVGSTRGYLVS
jgi:hypothetical protein